MRHAKWVFAAAFAAVLGLVGSACSSGGDSSPETATTEAAVGSVATTETVARPETTTTTTSASAAPRTGQAEPVPSVGTAGSDEPAPPTSGSAETVPSVSSSDSVSPETSEPPSSSTTTTTTTTAATTSASTTTTSTTTTSTTTTTTTTSTTTIPSADDLSGSLRPPARASSLRPRQDNNIQLPLPPSTPRDRYVPGLAAANPYTEANENNPASAGQLADLASFLKEIGDCSKHQLGTPQPEKCQNRLPLSRLYQAVEDLLEDLGFTPQNVCGAPPGYSFTSLLQPTRELDPEWNYHTGAAIRTTDRLVELHGGPRINPEENLSFYIRQAVQTTHDALRLPELLDQTETPQLILCRAWLAPSGEIPEFANGAWYALLTPGIQPRESLMSQGAYHMKYISNNGNRAFVYVCHPTLGAQEIALMWREAGYRAESVGERNLAGCQAAFEQYDNSGIPFQEPTTTFTFGERVFATADLQPFPRAGG